MTNKKQRDLIAEMLRSALRREDLNSMLLGAAVAKCDSKKIERRKASVQIANAKLEGMYEIMRALHLGYIAEPVGDDNDFSVTVIQY